MVGQIVLEARDLCRFFHSNDEEVCALRGVDLRVNSEEMVALVGPSGSGKSTLLACLAGTDEPDGGEVRILQERITRRPESQRAAVRARYVGFLLQSDNLIEHLTVEENVYLPVHLAGRGNKERVMALLEALDLVVYRRAYPAQLSGGEAARAGLAVALAASPKILLADEPTAEVDAQTEAWVVELMKKYCSDGGAVVMATHSVALAQRACRIVRLSDGKVLGNA
jgi:putative ABC transport system ATP-binding protein